MTEETDPLLSVTRDLREIESLAQSLPDEAAHKGADSTAMVMLGPVANLEAWQNLIDTAWEQHMEVCERDDCTDCDVAPHAMDGEGSDWEPPLQTLEWWSEQWRVEHNRETDRRGTVATEAGFLRSVLQWAYDHEPRFAEFTRDIRQARLRLENELRAGERAERGAPCMYDECGGVRLVRKMAWHDGHWEHTDWFCPHKPHQHTWDADAYARMVTAAHEATKRELIFDEMWTTIDVAAREIRRSYRTIQTWVNEGKVRTACVIAGRRRSFVPLADVRAQDERAARRRRGDAA